jgi:hypothetical protein
VTTKRIIELLRSQRPWDPMHWAAFK